MATGDSGIRIGRTLRFIRVGCVLGPAAAAAVVATFVLGTATGCRVEHSSTTGIQSRDPLGRILAIRQAGEARESAAVPLLVDRLEDENDAVRFYAILALERITGHRFGYHYGEPVDKQAAALERWRAYVRGGEHVASDTGNTKAASPGSGDASHSAGFAGP